MNYKRVTEKMTSKKDTVIKLLAEGTDLIEIQKKTGASYAYIRAVRDAVEFDDCTKEKEIASGKTKRQKEFDRITKANEKKKKEEDKNYIEQLEWEKKRMEEIYPYAFKYGK